jgi:uncharacterized protein (TIGR02466 family)
VSAPTLDKIEPLFASPLLQFTVPDAAALNGQLITEANARRAHGGGVTRSNRNGWHSADDFFTRTEPGCVALRAHIVSAVGIATFEVSPRFDQARWQMQLEGWINISGQGGYNAPHDHPAFAWSGVYYVAVPDVTLGDSGSIEFLDPRTNTRVPTVEGAACFLDTRKLRPKPGLLIIFPSYLRHWVYPNEEPADRISIAFNARFLPRPVG